MNPCPRYEDSLILYAYQELGRRKVVTLQNHLSQCERCRGYLDELNRIFQIIENHSGSSHDLFLDIQS
jgi:predicted anti-sigma-YlaC factor YlaD